MSNDTEIEERVVDQIRSRRDKGRAKYGTTMERTDLTPPQWIQHAQEEALDLAVYLEKLKEDMEVMHGENRAMRGSLSAIRYSIANPPADNNSRIALLTTIIAECNYHLPEPQDYA